MVKAELYQGTPTQILNKLSNEIKDILEMNGIPPSGIHAIALLHVACSIVRNHADYSKMPSFKTMLSILTICLGGREFSEEEGKLFIQEFSDIIHSLGGGSFKAGQPAPFNYVSPPDGRVH